jgi:hypothetical protein
MSAHTRLTGAKPPPAVRLGFGAAPAAGIYSTKERMMGKTNTAEKL